LDKKRGGNMAIPWDYYAEDWVPILLLVCWYGFRSEDDIPRVLMKGQRKAEFSANS